MGWLTGLTHQVWFYGPPGLADKVDPPGPVQLEGGQPSLVDPADPSDPVQLEDEMGLVCQVFKFFI